MAKLCEQCGKFPATGPNHKGDKQICNNCFFKEPASEVFSPFIEGLKSLGKLRMTPNGLTMKKDDAPDHDDQVEHEERFDGQG